MGGLRGSDKEPSYYSIREVINQMQETQYRDKKDGILKKLQEFFTGKDDTVLNKKMDKRLEGLKTRGHSFVRCVKIGRNKACPCGSGKKFKKCCIVKIRK